MAPEQQQAEQRQAQEHISAMCSECGYRTPPRETIREAQQDFEAHKREAHGC